MDSYKSLIGRKIIAVKKYKVSMGVLHMFFLDDGRMFAAADGEYGTDALDIYNSFDEAKDIGDDCIEVHMPNYDDFEP